MTHDRISSHREAQGFASHYNMGNQPRAHGNSKAMPFSKDVIEAIEKGDMETALKLIEAQKKNSEHNQIMIIAKRIGQGIFDAVMAPMAIVKAGLLKKGKKQFSPQNNKAGITEVIKAAYLAIMAQAAKISNIMGYIGTKIEAGYDAVLASIQNLSLRAYESAKKAMFDPVVNFLSPKVEAFAEMLKNRMDQLRAQVNKLTQPIVEKFNDATKAIANALEVVRNWTSENVDSALKEVKKVTEAVLEKSRELGKKVADIATKVKDQVVGIGEAAMQYIQSVPQVIAPFAFWLVKQVEVPSSNLKQNIIRFVQVSKKAFNRVAKALSNAGKVFQQFGESAAKKYRQIADLVEKKILPIIAEIYKKFVSFFTILLKELWAALKWVTIKIKAHLSQTLAKILTRRNREHRVKEKIENN